MGRRQPTFKPYHQHQLMLLPPSLEELIPKDHACRVVNEVINKINLEPLNAAYHLKGSSSYHPKMLLKVLVYWYVSNIYSSRKLEAACKESIYFMYLSSMSYPDHNTINRFRGVRLKGALRNIFEEVVLLLAEEGLLSIGPRIGDSGGLESQNFQSCTKLSNSLLLFSKFMKKGNIKGCCEKKRRNFQLLP